MRYTVLQNTAFMTAASVGQKVVSFVYFTIVARTIGVEGTGKYFFALSFTTLFAVLVDLGFTSVLIREAAQFREKLNHYLSSLLGVKMLSGLLTYGVMMLAFAFFFRDEETRQLVALSGLTMLFDSLHLTFYGVLRSLGDLRFEAGGIVASQILTLLLGSLFLFYNLPLIFLILAFTIPSMLNALFAGAVLVKTHGIRLVPRLNISIVRSLSVMALPFAVSAILARLYSYADTMILSRLLGPEAVGWYSIPYKITYAFQFVPLALVAAVYPAFSSTVFHDKKASASLLLDSLRYLLILAFPLAIGIALLAEDVVLSLYTADYLPSVLPLKILMIGLIFSFASFPIGALLNASNRQTTQTMIVGLALVANVFLNLLLIPKVGIVGSALAALVGNVILALFGFFALRRFLPIKRTELVRLLLRSGASTAVMGICVVLVNNISHFLLAILVGGVVYGVMLWLTKLLTKEDIVRIQTLMKGTGAGAAQELPPSANHHASL